MQEKDGSNGEQGSAKNSNSLRSNYSEEWRNECEARDLLTWPLAKRRKQLALICEKRGVKAYEILTQEMTRQWTEKQKKHMQQPNLSSTTEKPLEKPRQKELL